MPDQPVVVSDSGPMRIERGTTLCGREHRASWDWVQFVCALGVTAFIAFLDINPDDSLMVHVAKPFALALPLAWLGGRFGDLAWSWIVWVFRWLY